MRRHLLTVRRLLTVLLLIPASLALATEVPRSAPPAGLALVATPGLAISSTPDIRTPHDFVQWLGTGWIPQAQVPACYGQCSTCRQRGLCCIADVEFGCYCGAPPC
jgi:hypothetical protein